MGTFQLVCLCGKAVTMPDAQPTTDGSVWTRCPNCKTVLVVEAPGRKKT